ncbi:MAG: hypothetical protein Q4A66_09965, partial [Eubacteriales bacterium]|nr:hypothetical protein [Eubacteriales bacterium]
YIFTWCTFHNPVLQMSYTQYIVSVGGYMPTPNGLAVHMLWGMLADELQISGDTGYRARCTAAGDRLYLILSNPDDAPLGAAFKVDGLTGSRAKVRISCVDEQHNNALLAPPCRELSVTEAKEIEIAHGEIHIALTLQRYGFACLEINVE